MKKLLLRFMHCILVAGFMVLSVSNSAAQSPDADRQIALRLQTLTTGEKLLHWSGQADHTYFIQASDDLKDWTWAPNIEPGIAAPMSYEVDGPTAKGFFRLIRSPHTAANLDTADFDGDGLSNLYEITPRPRPGGINGYAGLSPNIQTNPILADTDGDLLSDKWELDHGLDPTDNGSRNPFNGPYGDPDSDGLTNADELALGTLPNSPDSDGDSISDAIEVASDHDPKSDQSFPTRFVSTIRNGQTNSTPAGVLAFWYPRQWVPINDFGGSLTELISAFSQIPFPAEIPNAPWPLEGYDLGLRFHPASIVREYVGNTGYEVGFVSHHRYWMETKPALAQEFKIQAIKITRQITGTNLPEEDREVLLQAETKTFTFSAGSTQSSHIDLLPTPAILLPGDYVRTEIDLIPVEVVDKDKIPISKLKVGKMFETGVLSGTGASAVLDIEKDSDRFFVRVKGGAAMGGISVKVSTTDNPEAAYNDNATQIDLVADGADAVSKSMLLVSDDVDDDHPVDSIADDVTGDRTHRIQLGGNFKIEEIKIGTGAWQALGTKVSVPFEKTVNVKLVNCRYGAIIRGPCWDPGEITFLKAVLKERYAQTGIKLNFSEVAGPWISVSGWLDPGEYPTEVVAGVLDIPQETKNIINDGPVIS